MVDLSAIRLCAVHSISHGRKRGICSGIGERVSTRRGPGGATPGYRRTKSPLGCDKITSCAMLNSKGWPWNEVIIASKKD